MSNPLARIMIMIGSSASIGFGVWHFTVPKDWKWYSYIDARATELIVAVRAINIFFSLALVLFGLMNLLLIIGNKSNRYSIAIVLGATCVLWFTRVLMQVIRPQGSMSPVLQYSMLSSFIVVFLCFAVPLFLVLAKNDFSR
ncbi:MAG TPA: hypothetical protein VN445_05480 [Rectinemataceae bacterium]|nr:hypothetical protein [Rectinemataceae bacterium]